jgi:ectoine hydroxylase-related dioxygenase (phytanoyl-CoA dioxygenase family)
MQLDYLKRTAQLAAVVDVLERDGAVVLEGMLDRSVVQELNTSLSSSLDRADQVAPHFVNPTVAAFFGDRTGNVTSLAAKCPAFVHNVLCHPVYMSLCDAVLLPSCARYQLNTAHVLDRRPGAAQQLAHRDEDAWINVPRPHNELALASVIALDPFTASNGSTRVVPGSHRWDRGRLPEPTEFVTAEMEPGSAVVYLGSTIHAGGANITYEQRRRGMHLSYVVGWLRTEENHYLAAPPAIARDMPQRAQEILGYAVHDAIDSRGGYLGAVDLQDPAQLLRTGTL